MYSCVWTGHRYSCQWTGHVYIYSHLRTGQLITLAYGPPRCSCTYYGLDSGILWTYTVKSPMDRTAESLTYGRGKWIPLPKDMTSIYSCLWTRQLLQTGNSWKFAFRLYTLTYLLLSKVGIRNLSPHLRNSAILRTTKSIAELRTKKSCGNVIADLQNLTFAIPQLSAVFCQSATFFSLFLSSGWFKK
jgi:hypothetical protein